ncbi:MAG TPA: DUF1801 domain-containing protein [Longimicrobiales bacterium]|nr:DUF1801 domain-containing protein [Longimicrobiales bacterium]
MSGMKTVPTAASVEAFLAGIADEGRRQDCQTVLQLMQRVTGQAPRMWGSSVVGFGDYHYKYASGREGDWFLAGFSPRKKDLTLYITSGLHLFPNELTELGKHKTGKGCLYIKRLADIDLQVLEQIVAQSVRQTAQLAGQQV